MATGKRPDGEIFASGAKEGEVQEFPAVPRGWGAPLMNRMQRETQ